MLGGDRLLNVNQQVKNQESASGLRSLATSEKTGKKGQEPEYDLSAVSEGATSTVNPSALVTAEEEEMAPVRERLWPRQ